MRVYDPAERIVYVHLASAQRHGTVLPPHDAVLERLPVGYANQSPRTRVRREPGTSSFDAALDPAVVRSGGPRPDPATEEAGEKSAIRLA